MVLADDVHDRRGRLLMPSGVTLQDKHLRSFRMWGVTHVDVEVDGDAEGIGGQDRLEPRAIEAAETELHELFRNAGLDHPLLHQLYDFCRCRRATAIQSREAS